MIKDGKIDIWFAVPAYEFKVSIETMRSLLETQAALLSIGYCSSFSVRPGDCFVDKARNKLVTDFLQDPAAGDNFMFVDDDVGGWDPQKIVDFIHCPDPIVCGVYPQKSDGEGWPVQLSADMDTGMLIEDRGYIGAELAPTGFMRIKRHVLETIAVQSKMFKDFDLVEGTGVPKEFYYIFESGPREDPHANMFYWGEDFYFCKKARANGFSIWVDPNITFTHRGQKRWQGALSSSLLDWRKKAMAAFEARKQKEAAE